MSVMFSTYALKEKQMEKLKSADFQKKKMSESNHTENSKTSRAGNWYIVVVAHFEPLCLDLLCLKIQFPEASIRALNKREYFDDN